MGQQGPTDSSRAPGTAATAVQTVWLELDAASGQYGFTTVAADADAAFTQDATSGQYGADTATTTHAPSVVLRNGMVLAFTTS